MIRIATALGIVVLLAACGANGPPTKPVVSGKQTIGVNSNTGVYTNTQIGITFPAN
ncbi:hypothetical protein [Celeribacter sp.]|uniref:hypothetical protein n=1 Tax=Celeribacter sp. TaxID=1890673 RepID=UPI003A9216E2